MLKKNDIIDVNIIDTGFGGEGIAKIDGYTVFVKNAIEGDRVKIKILKPNKSYAYAKIEEFIEKSSMRVSPKCPSFPKCGGCEAMHIKYENQLEIKENIVKNNIYKFTDYKENSFEFEKIIPSPNEYFYRNKAQIPVQKTEKGVSMGFYAQKSHRIVPFESCLITDENINSIAKKALEFVNNEKISAYSEETHKGILRNIYIRSFESGAMLTFVTNSNEKIKNIDKLVKMLDDLNITSIIQNINTKKGNVILGDKNITLWGNDYVYANLLDLKFKISPHSFFQINTKQTEILYNKAAEYADITRNDTVLDLYCGVGTITLTMAKYAKKSIGVEIVPEAIENAKENAKINNINNSEFYCGDCPKVVDFLLKDGLKADVVVVDPPRKGCDGELLDLIEKISPKKLVYVSCNSATLARDLNILKQKGFILKQLTPVDMFPHTTHCEVVAKIERE